MSSSPATTCPRAGRTARRFVILETGFGLGLNFLATWQAWRAAPALPADACITLRWKAPLPPR
jgi:tRNA U34 5-methylaminomethyl-2-thiouridine-forming methyltransferase MnmC